MSHARGRSSVEFTHMGLRLIQLEEVLFGGLVVACFEVGGFKVSTPSSSSATLISTGTCMACGRYICIDDRSVLVCVPLTPSLPFVSTTLPVIVSTCRSNRFEENEPSSQR